MKARLQEAMKEAMRAKDKLRLNTIRGALSAMQYEAMRKSKDELSDDEAVAVLKSEVKKRDEAIEYAAKDGRGEMRAELEAERGVLLEFLPRQVSQAELEEAVRRMKEAEPGIALGPVMKRLREEYGARLDGKLASEAARRILG